VLGREYAAFGGRGVADRYGFCVLGTQIDRWGALMLRLTRLVLALATLAALWPAETLAQIKAGVVTNLEGSATAARSLAPQPVSLKFKDDVLQNDRIVTGDRSIVRMLLGGKAVVTVRERSSLTITEVPGKSTIDLDNGKIAVAVAKEQMRPGESFEVRTPNAVAAVRGTAFIIEVIRATAQGPGAQAVSGATTNIYGFGGLVPITFLSGQTFNVVAGNFAGGTGSQLANFGIMTQQQAQGAGAGVLTSPQNTAAGRQNTNEQSMGTAVATFGQPGGGLPVVAEPTPQPAPPVVVQAQILPGGQPVGGGAPPPPPPPPTGGFKPSGTPTAHLIFGDRFEKDLLKTDLQSLGKSVTMNVSSLPNDLSSFGTIWHVGAFVALTSDEQSRLSSHLALGRGLHLTGERPCCDTMNASLTTFVHSVVKDGASITVGNQGDISGSYTFNPTARGNISTNSNTLTTWNPSAPGGIAGVSGANVFVSGAGGVAVGAVWDSADLVSGGRLTLLMDVNWFSNSNRLPVIENIEHFIDDPAATLTLAGPLFRSTGEQFASSSGFLDVDGYTVIGSGNDALLWLSGTTVTTAGHFLRLSDSDVSLAGSFVRLEGGSEIIQTSTGEPLVSVRGGLLVVGTGASGGHLFELSGRPGATQVDSETGLTLGTDRPLQPGAESSVFEATNGAVVTVAGSAYRVDTALLEATAPLIAMASGSSLTTSGHTVDLVNRAKVSIPNDAVAMISLNASVLNVNNANLVNVAGGSQLSIAGSLLSLSGGSTLSILNGLLLNVTGGSRVSIGNSLVSFSGSGNLLSVTNSFAPTAIIGGIPVYGPVGSFQITSPTALAGLGTSGTIRINGVALTPTTLLSSLTGSLVAVQGSGAVKVGK
jgi:hypothetical protein